MSDTPEFGEGIYEPADSASTAPVGATIEKTRTEYGVRPAAVSEPDTEPIGVMGTALWGGYVEVIEDNKKLLGREKWKTYSNILANCTIAAAGVRYFLNLVSKPKWSADPADDSARAKELAERVEKEMDAGKIPWHRTIRRAAMFRFKGFSLLSWTLVEREDGSFGFEIRPRSEATIERWIPDEFGEIQQVIQRSPQDHRDIPIPMRRLIYLVDDSLSDSPEGLGIFRHIAEAARRLERFEQLEGYGLETDLRGIPVGKAPFAALSQAVENGDITKEKANEQIEVFRKFIRGHIRSNATGLLVDSIPYESSDEAQRPSGIQQWQLELLTSSASSLPDIAKAIDRLNHEIARVLGVQHMLLGSSGPGSFALSNDASTNFAMIVDGTVKELIEGFERQWLERLFEVNGWEKELMPKLRCEKIQHRSPSETADILQKLALAGSPTTPGDPAGDVVRQEAGLPPVPEESIMMMDELAPAGAGGPAQSGPPGGDQGGETNDQASEET